MGVLPNSAEAVRAFLLNVLDRVRNLEARAGAPIEIVYGTDGRVAGRKIGDQVQMIQRKKLPPQPQSDAVPEVLHAEADEHQRWKNGIIGRCSPEYQRKWREMQAAHKAETEARKQRRDALFARYSVGDGR